MKIRDRIKELRRVKASELIPNPKNWRTHPIAQQDALKGILAEVGFAGAVLARELDDGSLMLIDGHMRAETTHDQEIPVLILDVDEAESDKLLATFDPIAAMAESDPHALDALLRNVDTGSEALQKMLAELAEGAGLYQDKEVLEDEVPEPPVDPITKAGDLWILGDHRVLCGDSTKREDVDRVMDGERAACVVTDPPYGVAYSGQKETMRYGKNTNARVREKITGDATPEEAEAITTEALSNCTAPIAFVWCAPQFHDMAKRAALHNGYELFALIVWNKNMANFGAMGSTYKPKYEMALACKRKGGNIPFYGLDNETTVWDFDRASKNEFHPTQKPTDLFARAITNHSQPGETVFDPFLGSGTTLIAAEQLGRKCYGMEISPAYCDVIVQRWEKLTGKTATLEVKNG